MILDPKTSFKSSPFAKTWTDVIDSTQFAEAAKAALLILQRELAKPGSEGELIATSSKLAGANRFLDILMTLTEPGESPAPRPRQNLDMKV